MDNMLLLYDLLLHVECDIGVIVYSCRQDLGFIPSGNVVLSSTYVGKILGADQLLVILCYRYQESGIGYWILSMTISGSGVTFLPSCCNGSGVTFLPKMFDIDDLHDDEVIVDMVVGEKQEKSAKIDEREVSTGVEDSDAPTIPVTTADEGVSAAKIDEITPTNAPTTVIDELTLAQTLIEIKAAKLKAVTIAATTTTTRPKAKGVVV
ncbi:hypothetical protein Tco_0010953 [Tanacetum coccineum]